MVSKGKELCRLNLRIMEFIDLLIAARAFEKLFHTDDETWRSLRFLTFIIFRLELIVVRKARPVPQSLIVDTEALVCLISRKW
jgi:hypothetical protein